MSSFFAIYFFKLNIILFYIRIVYYHVKIFLILLSNPVILINQKVIRRQVDFPVPFNHRVNIKENEMINIISGSGWRMEKMEHGGDGDVSCI